jgi:type IV secretory pathway VirD2 relaxase
MIDPDRFTAAGPAHRFPAASHPFRVRVGKGRADAPPPQIVSLAKAVRAMSSKKDGGGGRAGWRGQLGRALANGHSVAGSQTKTPWQPQRQRVIVKARVVRNRPGAPGKRAIREHLAYLERDEVGEGGERGQSFGADDDLSPRQVGAFAQRVAPDRHHFRLIVSPENGASLNLEEYTREYMRQTEGELGTRLDWVAAVHQNTDNPHVHITIRGVNERGADLVIRRDYISHGLRETAQEIATHYLGPRLEGDIDRATLRNISAEHLTPIDRRLIELAGRSPDGLVSTRRPTAPEPDYAYRTRLTDIGRLQHLEGMGFAEEMSSGQWAIDPNLEGRLRDRGQLQDILERLREHLGPKERPREVVRFNKEAPPGVEISGEVIDRGAVSEVSDQRYIVVNAVDGKAYHVALSRFSEQPGQEVRRGSIITLVTRERPVASRADQNIVEHASRHAGIYDAQTHRDEVIRSARLPHGVDSEEFVRRHVARLEGHARRRLVEQLDTGQFKVGPDLVEQLQQATGRGRDSGAVVEVVQESSLGLREQMSAQGPTWLDGKIAAGEHLKPIRRIGASRFEMRVRAAMRGRLAQLRERGLTVERDGQTQLRGQALDEMYQREHATKAATLSRHYGQHVDLASGHDFRGKVERLEQLASGPHAVIAKDGRFALVPARNGLARQLGKNVSVSLGRGRGAPSLAIPMQMQDMVRYVALEALSRQRTMGRSL